MELFFFLSCCCPASVYRSDLQRKSINFTTKMKKMNCHRKKLNAKNGSVVLKHLQYITHSHTHMAKYAETQRENSSSNSNDVCTGILQKHNQLNTQFSFLVETKRSTAQRQWKMLTAMFLLGEQFRFWPSA